MASHDNVSMSHCRYLLAMLNYFQSQAAALTHQQRALRASGLTERTWICDGVTVGVRKEASLFQRDHERPNTQPADTQDVTYLARGADVKSTIMIPVEAQRKVLHQLVVSSFTNKKTAPVSRTQYNALNIFIEKNCSELLSYVKVSFSLSQLEFPSVPLFSQSHSEPRTQNPDPPDF